MAYNPTEWKTGDTITAEKLNKAENAISANATAIAEIPEGLQLYGPYIATGSHSIEAGAEVDISLTSMEDVNGITVNPPDSEGIVLFTQFSAMPSGTTPNKLLVMKLLESMYIEDGTWQPAHITVFNGEESTLTVNASMTLYSTVEFTQE